MSNDILIPRYYDPTVDRRLQELATTHDPVSIGELLEAGEVSAHYGHDIGKMTYGGHIPYVRTSDLNGWEVVAAPKQAVGVATYQKYAARQDVQVGDVLFVRDGLYLIGNCAIVTAADLPMIHQSHLIRLRPTPRARLQGPLLLALLSTAAVRLQVRSKQFTAGIIDKIEDRYRELVLPVPRGCNLADVNEHCLRLITRRVELRERLRRIPLWVQGLVESPEAEQPRDMRDNAVDPLRIGFTVRASSLSGNVLIPKYYNPAIRQELASLGTSFRLVTIGELVAEGVLDAQTGIEVGKLAYGLGGVPFVRTSDISDWELRGESKHTVSESVFESFAARTDVRAGDVLVVRDGTYLVGTSAIVTSHDRRLLYAGGLYKLRSLNHSSMPPHLLLALLNTPVVKRQMRALQFTRDIIDTLGRRLFDLVLPVPRDHGFRDEVDELVRTTVEERVQLREESRRLALSLEGRGGAEEEGMESWADELGVSI